MTKRYFEFVEGSSSKFWEIWRDGTKVMTRYGKLGAAGQTTVKDEGDEAKATKLHDKLVTEKTKKGYVEKGAAKAAPAPAPVKKAPAAKAAPPAKAAPAGGSVPSLAGKVIVVTGTFSRPRKEIEAILEASGATVGSSVTKKTQLLIVGEDAGSKLEKAEELGVEIMEEADFNDLLDGGGDDAEDGDGDGDDEGDEGSTGNEGFTHTLFERLKAWAELLGKRSDLEFKHPLELKKGDGSADYPADAAAFAKSATTFNFSYRHREKTEVGGFLYLSLDGSQEDAYMELDGEEVDADAMYMLDCDAEGTGLATWYILREDEAPLIIWDVETMAKFSSLNEYLTEGAKRAFAYSPCWQNRGEAPLGSLSLPESTPLAALKDALVKRGASAAMADDLLKWLGPAVRLLLPAP